MSALPVIAIFDAGKTNKKLVLFDEQYRVVHEEHTQLAEVMDDDGFPCEDVHALTRWVRETFGRVCADTRFNIRGVNFSAYGATFVLLDEALKVALPLYNYLKPYPPALKRKFYETYGGESVVAKETASPVLGSLNSGMQLYRLKHERPALFDKVRYALHLPNYLSFVVTGSPAAELTSIGCHTNLWDFQNRKYHRWVTVEGIDLKLPSIVRPGAVRIHQQIAAGGGLHDSSAALIPYLTSFTEPFILLSTGTWCISLNPFNHTPLSEDELRHDCLCYLSSDGKPVKAARVFAGFEHEQQSARLKKYFEKPADYGIPSYDPALLKKDTLEVDEEAYSDDLSVASSSGFFRRNLQTFDSYEAAYHRLIADIVNQQMRSMNLINGTGVQKILVDGGFVHNPIFMHLVANTYPTMEVCAATTPLASALGAALRIHRHWNTRPLPDNILRLKRYSPAKPVNQS